MNSVQYKYSPWRLLLCHQGYTIIWKIKHSHSSLKTFCSLSALPLGDILSTTSILWMCSLLMFNSCERITHIPHYGLPKPLSSRNKIPFLRRKMRVAYYIYIKKMLRVSSHHSRWDQNLPKRHRDKGKWSEAAWWKQVTLFTLPPLSPPHLCRKGAFRKAAAHTGFPNLGNRTQIDHYHQHTGHLQTAPTWVFKSVFWSVEDKGNALSCAGRKQVNNFNCFPRSG